MIPGNPEFVWEDGRSAFDALYEIDWRQPGTIVHYPITNSCPFGKRLKSLSADRLSAVSCFSCFLSAGPFDFQTFSIRKELHFYPSKHQAETHPHWNWTDDRHSFSELQYSESSSLDPRVEESNRRVFVKSQPLSDFGSNLVKH